MRLLLKSEALALLGWITLSLVLAATITPWLYQLAKAFANFAAHAELPTLLESWAHSCGRAGLKRVFSRSLAIAALTLLPFLIWRVRFLGKNQPHSILNLRTYPPTTAATQLLTGFLIAASTLGSLILLLDYLGAFVPNLKNPTSHQIIHKILIPSAITPLIEEWLFRGLLLGLWLRSSGPLAACIGSSFLFSFLHFLAPPEGFSIADPAAPLAGFHLLSVILFHFADPHFFITDFATLFIVGLILAWLRIATGSLWLGIGLHSGWILAFKCGSTFYTPDPHHWLKPWGIGENLRSGTLPLLSLILTAAICHLVIKHHRKTHATPA